VVDLDGQPALVLTRRASSLSHGGDWVFPGGAVDTAIESHEQAAVREAAEELGIEPGRIRVVGQLSRHGPIISGHLIETFVGVVDGTLGRDLVFAPDPDEVAEIEIVPIRELADPSRRRRAPLNDAGRLERIGSNDFAFEPDVADLLYYEIRPGHDLWGLQANMLEELLTHLAAHTTP
jgi:8-oxo-dGTP pyrophosphatase MutT (NUDIX family)